MQQLLSAGIGPLTWLVGRFVFRHLIRSRESVSVLERNVTRLGIGVAVMTPVLVMSALSSHFSAAWIGSAGWIAASLAVVRAAPGARLGTMPDRIEWIALALASVFVVLAYSGRDDTLVGGRDQQVYANYAVGLARFGDVAPRFAARDEADRLLMVDPSLRYIPGSNPPSHDTAAPMTSYLPYGFMVWLAEAYAVGGYEAMFGLNAVVMALGGLTVFGLLRRWIGPVLAIGACALFFALPLSIWIGGLNLSEPLALWLLLQIPIVLATGTRRAIMAAAGVLFSICLFRIDAMVAVPALILAFALHTVIHPDRDRISDLRFLSLVLLTIVAACCIWYAAAQPEYFGDLSHQLALLTYGTAIVTLGVHGLNARQFAASGRALALRPVRLACVASLVALFVYAATIRPGLGSPSIIEAASLPLSIVQQASAIIGARDFRELAVPNLAAYASWPVLLAAVAGIGIAVWSIAGKGRTIEEHTVVALALVFGGLYLWFPSVSPDQPWGARRFVPVILPALVIYAAIFADRLLFRLTRVPRYVGAAALALCAVPVWAALGPRAILVRETLDPAQQVDAIAKAMPDALIVVDRPLWQVGAALFVAYRKQLVFADLDSVHQFESVTRWIQAKAAAGAPSWILHDGTMPRRGAHSVDKGSWRARGRALVPVAEAPARVIADSELIVQLTRIDGLDPNAARSMFGGEPVWGFAEGGFFAAEVAPFGVFRYAGDLGWIDVPATPISGARALKLDLFAFAASGRGIDVAIRVGGKFIWQGAAPGGVSTVMAPLPTLPSVGLVRIEFWSETVNPRTLGVVDSRDAIGIGLIGIRPIFDPVPPATGPGMAAFRSRLERIDAGHVNSSASRKGEVLVAVANEGTAAWPTLREQNDVAGAIQLGLRWYRVGARATIVGDNRLGLSITLLPGDSTRIRVPLDPLGLDARALPPGEYEVDIGLVRETVAWFADSGDPLVRVRVTVGG